MSRAPLEEKVTFCVKLFDFNDVGGLAYDECVVALLSVLCGAPARASSVGPPASNERDV